MKKFIIVALLALSACHPKTELVEVIKGDTGSDGSNGHSIVSLISDSSEIECSTSGQRLDLYIDNDDSLSANEGDTYLNSLVTCDGLNGLAGSNGLDGTNGIDGIDGAQGPRGCVGPRGATGSQGIAGPMGPAGPQGPQGIAGATGASGATITQYGSSSCTVIAGTSSYVKTSNNTVSLYTSNTCSSNTKFATVAQGESYWVGAHDLAVFNTDSSIRVIHFN